MLPVLSTRRQILQPGPDIRFSFGISDIRSPVRNIRYEFPAGAENKFFSITSAHPFSRKRTAPCRPFPNRYMHALPRKSYPRISGTIIKPCFFPAKDSPLVSEKGFSGFSASAPDDILFFSFSDFSNRFDFKSFVNQRIFIFPSDAPVFQNPCKPGTKKVPFGFGFSFLFSGA